MIAIKKTWNLKLYHQRRRLISNITDIMRIQSQYLNQIGSPEMPGRDYYNPLDGDKIAKEVNDTIKHLPKIVKEAYATPEELHKKVFEVALGEAIALVKKDFEKIGYYKKGRKKSLKEFEAVAEIEGYKIPAPDLIYDDEYDVEELSKEYLIKRALGIFFSEYNVTTEGADKILDFVKKMSAAGKFRKVENKQTIKFILDALIGAIDADRKVNVNSFKNNIGEGVK